jgi:hypothetical protein
MGAFLLGFLTGVLVCLGAGGAFAFVNARRSAVRMEAIQEMAERARAEAEMQRHAAREAEARALKAKKEAEEALRKSERK